MHPCLNEEVGYKRAVASPKNGGPYGRPERFKHGVVPTDGFSTACPQTFAIISNEVYVITNK